MKKDKILHLLKIIGKVLIVVYACIGVICTAILLVSAIKDKLEHDDNSNHQLNNVVTTSLSKGVIDIASSQYFLSSADITWDKFYHGVLTDFDPSWTYEHNSDYLVNYDTTSNYAQVGNINVRYATTDEHGNALDVANWPVKNLNGLTITKDYVSPTWCNYTLEFYWKHSSSTTWTIKYFWRVYHNLEIDGSTSTGNINIEQTYFFTSSNATENPIYYQWTLEFINAQNEYYMVKWFCKDDVSYLSGYNDGYNYGYSNGSQSGYTSGYNEGYNVGSTGMSTNPFNLISNAFESFANILDIQVIPGLSLGVLFFTPLIFGLIIVLFKMIRG